MNIRILSIACALVLMPVWLLAAETTASAPAGIEATPATTTAPAAVSNPTAPYDPPSTAAPAPVPAPVARKVPKPDYTSYLVVKGGWFGSDGDYQGSDFSGSEAWEVAVGTGRNVGFEFGVGYMSNSASNIKVDMVPLLLSLRLQVPIGVFAPNAEVGGGAYFTEATVGSNSSKNDTTFGWHAGLGCDLLLGRFLVGAQARYMGISPKVEGAGEVTMDRYQGLIRAGVRF